MGLSSSIVVVIAVVLSAATILVVVGNWLMNRRHHRERRQHDVPNLVMPLDSSGARRMSPAYAQRVIVPPAPRPSPRSVAIITPPPTLEESDIDYNDDDLFLGEDDQLPEEEPPSNAADESAPADTGPIDTTRTPSSPPPVVRFAQQHPEDGTLEFLPGRLEVIGGQDQGQEIHFVRPRDLDPPVVTFGRGEGPRHRHVQLLDRTVSRTHARMTWRNERWTLENLSKTNPLSLNGAVVAEGGPPVTLGEGDRIELGAVVFVFRER